MKSLSEIVVVVRVALAWICVVSVAWGTPRADMVGQVRNETDEPVPNATVIVAAAGPREGSSPLSPYCYSDFGKKAVTDAQGNFRIESLDPDLHFTVIAWAPGYAPSVSLKLIPEAGSVSFKLKPRYWDEIPAQRHVAGRVIDSEGDPLVGAVISVEGMRRSTVTSWGGNEADKLTVTDENGEYHIIRNGDFDALYATVNAPSLARRWAKLEGGNMQLLRMKKGSTIRGHLLVNGQPLQGVKLNIFSVSRSWGEQLSGFEATTDATGQFVFNNMPPETEFVVFGLIDSFEEVKGSLWQIFTSPADGHSIDLGEIKTKPLCRVAGRVILSDGKPVPAGTRIRLNREEAWGSVTVLTDEQGNFEVVDVPPERVSIDVSVRGYRLSKKNPNLNPNRFGLEGRVTGDINDLTILLDPSKPLGYDMTDRPSAEEQLKRRESVLRGVQ